MPTFLHTKNQPPSPAGDAMSQVFHGGAGGTKLCSPFQRSSISYWAPTVSLGQLSRSWGRRHPLQGQLRCWGALGPAFPTHAGWLAAVTQLRAERDLHPDSRESPAGSCWQSSAASLEHKAPIHSFIHSFRCLRGSGEEPSPRNPVNFQPCWKQQRAARVPPSHKGNSPSI